MSGTKRVVIDPITRIEGHMRIELLAGEGVIDDAWACTTQYRGIEVVLKGRDPRDAWAFAQRICGVCTSIHALGSILAVEDAVSYPVPEPAKLIRTLISQMQLLQDHVIHFYQLQALDWVDVVSALSAEPAETAQLQKKVSPQWPMSSTTYFAEVQAKIKNSVAGGQYSIFTNGYWGHPAYKLPPAVNLMAVAHYLEALDWQRDVIKLHTIFGGKNPHPNFLVGGMACAINMDADLTINQMRIDQLSHLVERAVTFIEQVYFPDTVAIAGFYPDWWRIGASNPNFMAVGEPGALVGGDPNSAGTSGAIKPGLLLNGDYRTVVPFDQKKILEFISSAWYTYPQGDEVGLPPWQGVTDGRYTGPKPPVEWLSSGERYTWTKCPRYDGHAIALGPNARMMLGYAQGVPEIRGPVDESLQRLGLPRDIALLNSTLGRTFSRALESVTTVRRLKATFDDFVGRIKAGNTTTFNPARWEPSSWPARAEGVGWVEAPRGTLSHWVVIQDGAIANYQAVVPSTWNSSGRDAKGQMGPFEYSLAHSKRHPLVEPEKPLEVLRTIHSYDPCQSCAVQVMHPRGRTDVMMSVVW
jgi:hydrogenase large subunit